MMTLQWISNYRRLLVCIGVPALMLLLCLCWPIDNWFRSILKQLPEIRLPYIFSFFLLLVIWLLVLRPLISSKSWTVSTILGAIVGQISGAISISVAGLITNGPHNFVKSMKFFGLLDNIFVVNLIVAVLLGSWIFGAISFALIKRLAKGR